MSTLWKALREELPSLSRLAFPLVMAELGWMAMGVVDTVMAGRAGRDMLGMVALGHGLYYTFAIFGVGMLLGLDALIAQAYGRRDLPECQRCLAAGLVVSFFLAPPITAAAWGMGPVMDLIGIEPGLRDGTMGYLRAVSWGTLPLMLYAALRRYLQAQNIANPVMFALVTANLINAACNWVLIFGRWGMPALGAAGSGYATSIARVYMVAVLLYVLVSKDGWSNWTEWPGWSRISAVLSLGLPAALQISLEVAVFALTTSLLGKLGPVALGGHQIALNIVSVTYMVPLGISSAVAVRVGQAVGRGEPRAAQRSGWVAILLGGTFMFLAAVLLWTAPESVALGYTSDPEVVEMAVALLSIAAWFQLFDGIQTVATGALRGLGDTRTAMITHVICYWGVGLPLGLWLAFGADFGARGLWIGLSLALILIGLVLITAWRRAIGQTV